MHNSNDLEEVKQIHIQNNLQNNTHGEVKVIVQRERVSSNHHDGSASQDKSSSGNN